MKKLIVLFTLSLFNLALIAQPCSDLFFSEYIEGSGQNKALEIYNPTSSAINLSDYSVNTGTGGSSTATHTVRLAGSLAPGAVYVIANANAANAILNVADTTSTVTYFNGDDAVWLKKISSNTVIDIIGERGVDPGSSWVVGSGKTEENTLVRKIGVQSGTTDWSLSVTQWNVFPQDDLSHIGSHSMTPCGPITDTLVNFNTLARSVDTSQSPVNIALSLNAISASSNFTVDIVLESGDTSNISGYTGETLSFSSVNAQVSVNLSFTTITVPQQFVFKLRNPSGNLQLGADSVFTLTVAPPSVIPTYTIAKVRGNNTNGGPDSLGVKCQLSGTVIGPNYLPAGLQFTINDGTAGISVRVPNKNFTYTVNEGDSVTVIGQVDGYRGLAQMAFLDTVLYVAPGRNISPSNVTTLDESTEGELIRMENVQIVDVFTAPAGTTYDARVGSFNFSIYIDSDVISANNDPIAGYGALISVIGVGGQFGSPSAPYTSGYQIIPRKISDIEVDLTSSVSELNKGISNIYPNPAQNNLFIQLENGINAEQVMVFDITGKNVSNKIASKINAGNISLDISTLQNGSYIAQIRTKESNIQTKFIIRK